MRILLSIVLISIFSIYVLIVYSIPDNHFQNKIRVILPFVAFYLQLMSSE